MLLTVRNIDNEWVLEHKTDQFEYTLNRLSTLFGNTVSPLPPYQYTPILPEDVAQFIPFINKEVGVSMFGNGRVRIHPWCLPDWEEKLKQAEISQKNHPWRLNKV